MSKYVIDDTTLTGIANAIREKDESTDAIPVADMAARIGAIDTAEDLSPELTAQDDLITQLQTAIQGKAGASGSEYWYMTGIYDKTLSKTESIVIEIPGAPVFAVVSQGMAVSNSVIWWDGLSKTKTFGNFTCVLDGNKITITTSVNYGNAVNISHYIVYKK